MMKTLALLLSLAVLVGCASNKVEVEQSDRYAKLEPAQHIKASPVPLPQTPQLKIAEVGGQEVAVLDGDGVNALNAYRAAARQNTEALALLLTAHGGLVDQRNLMLENLKLEENRANFYAERYAVSETARRDQYDEFQMELLIHKTMMILMGVALVL